MQDAPTKPAQTITMLKWGMWINPLIMIIPIGYVWWVFRDSEAQIYVLIAGAVLIIGDFFLMRFILKRAEANHQRQQAGNVIIE